MEEEKRQKGIDAVATLSWISINKSLADLVISKLGNGRKPVPLVKERHEFEWVEYVCQN